MLSLYRAWLPPLCLPYPHPALPRPAPPPGAHRPIPRRAPLAPASPASPASSVSTELDVEHVQESEPEQSTSQQAAAPGAVLDIACCDGPVRFSRVLNESWTGARDGLTGSEPPARCRHAQRSPHCYRKHAPRHQDTGVQSYPCKTCGSKFPSYYFVHKHRKRCHADEEPGPSPARPRSENHQQPGPSTSAAATALTA